MVSFEIFVKSMPPSLSELKVLPSFCFAFKIPDNVTVTNMHLSKINIFSLYHIRTMEDYQHPPESLQNSDFQIHFSVTKILRIFILAIV